MAGSQGFEVVEYRKVTGDTLDAAMDYFAEAVTKNDFHQMALWHYMIILPMGNPWEPLRNFHVMHGI